MKYILMMMSSLLLVACESSESTIKIRPEAVDEITKNMGEAEAERFLLVMRETQEKHVENCRKRVANTTTPQELSLAEDSLREARSELHRIDRDLEELR